MGKDILGGLLQLLELYKLKQVPRSSSNHYYDEKDNLDYQRRETTAEHVYSSLRLADFFLTTEPEFADVDRLHAYELILGHDDLEIITRDDGIADRSKRASKAERERAAIPVLLGSVPAGLEGKLASLYDEYRANQTRESQFVHAVDKMDALVHELQYPQDWGPKGFDEANVRAWFGPAFVFSPTFTAYFEATVTYLRDNGYFDQLSMF